MASARYVRGGWLPTPWVGVASPGEDGTVRLWSGFSWRDFAALKDRVCRLVGNDLGPAEWAQYAPAIAYRETCP